MCLCIRAEVFEQELGCYQAASQRLEILDRLANLLVGGLGANPDDSLIGDATCVQADAP